MCKDCWIKDVSRSDGVEILGIGTEGGERASVDDSLHLYDERIEDVYVERMAIRVCRKVTFEKADDSFPYSTVVWSRRRYKIPFKALAMQNR